ncbi:hypothetical protein ACNKHT_18085 [Shigella flexneri]
MLISRGEVKKRRYVDAGDSIGGKTQVKPRFSELLDRNPSFVFFKPQSFAR